MNKIQWKTKARFILSMSYSRCCRSASRFFSSSISKSVHDFIPLFLREITPPFFSSCGHVCSCLRCVYAAFMCSPNFFSVAGRHTDSPMTFSDLPSNLFRWGKSVNSFSSIGSVGKVGVSGEVSEHRYPFSFGLFPLGGRNSFKYLHDWFKSKTEKFFQPVCSMMRVCFKLRWNEVSSVSTLGILGFSYVSNKVGSRINEAVNVSDIIRERTSRLFVQVAHGLDSIVRGLSAPLNITIAEAI
jgi:hypothetical protein